MDDQGATPRRAEEGTSGKGIDRRTFLRYAGVAGLGAAVAGGAFVLATNPPFRSPAALTVYSGRGEDLVGPLFRRFQEETGVGVRVKYGGTAELAATILEEGANSPADLYFAQDAGALGALSREGRLQPLPDDVLAQVEARFRSDQGDWVGLTGRARTVDYHVENVNRTDLPTSIWGLTDARWGPGAVGWAPTNGSFQAFVTALRVLEGDDAARAWLQALKANEPVPFPNNTSIVAALGRGEVDVGLVNNYYLHRFQAVDPNFPVAHHYTEGDAGAMINVAGVALVDTVRDRDAAEALVRYLLGEDAQRYFALETFEYPLVGGIRAVGPQRPISEIRTPDLDLNDLWDLEGTLALLQEVGAL
jgi:iron(III) transport system substrate-binding protein